MSAKSHSGRFSPTRPTRSPGSIPRAMSACATSRACSAYCSQGMDSHSPRRFRRRATFRGCMAARAKKVAGTLSCATGGALVRTIRREVGRPGGAFLLAENFRGACSSGRRDTHHPSYFHPDTLSRRPGQRLPPARGTRNAGGHGPEDRRRAGGAGTGARRGRGATARRAADHPHPRTHGPFRLGGEPGPRDGGRRFRPPGAGVPPGGHPPPPPAALAGVAAPPPRPHPGADLPRARRAVWPGRPPDSPDAGASRRAPRADRRPAHRHAAAGLRPGAPALPQRRPPEPSPHSLGGDRPPGPAGRRRTGAGDHRGRARRLPAQRLNHHSSGHEKMVATGLLRRTSFGPAGPRTHLPVLLPLIFVLVVLLLAGVTLILR